MVSWDPGSHTFALLPLAGATVYVDGVSVGTTGVDGTLSFSNMDVSATGLSTVGASAEDQFSSELYTYLADNGTLTLGLEKKLPGQIYLKSAALTLNDTVVEVLTGYNTAWLPQDGDEPCGIQPTVDWNDIDEGGAPFAWSMGTEPPSSA